MRLYEILNKVILNRTSYRSQEPIDFIVISNYSGGDFLYSTEHCGVQTIAYFSKDFLEAEVSYIQVVDGRLNIHIEDITKNKHWKLEEDLNKLYDLHGVSWINKQEKEKRIKQQEDDDCIQMYDEDDD